MGRCPVDVREVERSGTSRGKRGKVPGALEEQWGD